MNTTFLRNLYSCFGCISAASRREWHAPHFHVFDRDAVVAYPWPESDPDGLRPIHRFVWPKTRLCEAYVYGGDTDQSVIFELRHVYSICREDIEQYVRGADGCVEELRNTWLVRLEIPLTREGAQHMCQLADIVVRCGRRSIRHRHYMMKLADSLRRVATAINLTTGSIEGVGNQLARV